MATTTKTKATSAPLKATPTKASTSVAVRKPSNANIVSITEQLKKQAEAVASQTLPPTGSKIRVAGKQFHLPDGTKSAGPLELVVVEFRTTHSFYEGAYDPNNITAPACFASGTDPKNMVPTDASPNKQADKCNDCPMHEWGSDGKRKACKERRLMAVLPPDATEDTPLWLLETSPTANKGFDAYVTSVARTFQMPPIGVVTEVSLNDQADFGQLMFGNPQPNKQLAEMFGRQEEAKAMLDAKRDFSNYEAPAKVGAKAAVRKPATRRP